MATPIQNVGVYAIALDGNWSLRDLAGFSKAYEQVYSFLWVLEAGDTIEEGQLAIRFHDLSWTRGFSGPHFYASLRELVPSAARPRVRSIAYASPGTLMLALAEPVAYSIKRVIHHACEAVQEIADTYHHIYKQLKERDLLRMDVRMRQSELRQVEANEASNENLNAPQDGLRIGSARAEETPVTRETANQREDVDRDNDEFIAYALGTLKAQMVLPPGDALDRLAPNDLARVKVLLSFYRRVIELRAFQLDGKAQL